jgi:hypothetical protein
MSAQDISKIGEFVSPDFRGNPKLDEHLGHMFKLIKEEFLKFKIIPVEIIAEGNRVVVRWHETRLLRPEEPLGQNSVAKRLNWTGLSLYEFDPNGLFVDGDVVVRVEGETAEERIENKQ